MILRTQENKANKQYDFSNFDFFYKFFIRLVNEQKFRDLKSFANFNFESDLIKGRFLEYFNSHSKSTVREIRNALHCEEACPTKVEFWIERGWDRDYAEKQIFAIQSENGNRLSQKLKVDKNARVTSTQIEYYLNRGHSLEESKQLLKERQSTFTMTKLIKKYGSYENAKKVFKRRQEKWRETLDERFAIETQNLWRSKGSYCSKESLELFVPIYNYFKHNFCCFLKYADEGKTEYFINDGNGFFCYDFVIKDLGLIFEFQGEHVHANKNWDKERLDAWRHAFSGITAEEYFEQYNKKIRVAEEHGFKVIELWESDGLEKNSQIIFDEIQRTLEAHHNTSRQF